MGHAMIACPIAPRRDGGVGVNDIRKSGGR
jgi:hypothetical protein